MSVLNNNPIFTVDIEGANLSYFVNINGVAVYNEFSHGGKVALTVPVNHFMHPKETVLAIDVVPPEPGDPFKPSAWVRASLNVHKNGNPERKVTIATIEFSEKALNQGEPTKGSSKAGLYEIAQTLEAHPEGTVKVGDVVPKQSANYEGSVLYERKLVIPNPLPLWAFFGSDELPDYFTIPDEEYYPELEDLLKEYQKVQSALETGDIDSIMPMFQERNKEIDLAFYREPGTTEQKIRESLKESAGDDDLVLVELKADYVGMTPEENRKLVKLTRSDEKAAIGLNFVEGGGSVNYDLVFRRKNGQWILTR